MLLLAGQDLGFKVDTPLSVFVEKLKNLTVPTTVTEVCAPASFALPDCAVHILTHKSVQRLAIVLWSHLGDVARQSRR